LDFAAPKATPSFKRSSLSLRRSCTEFLDQWLYFTHLGVDLEFVTLIGSGAIAKTSTVSSSHDRDAAALSCDGRRLRAAGGILSLHRRGICVNADDFLSQ
jgi:hypothetical protein